MAPRKRTPEPVEDEEPEYHDPDLERILDEYMAHLKATTPSDEVVIALFDAAGARCECRSSDCEHMGRCVRSLHVQDRATKPPIGYLQWEALPVPESNRYEIVCAICRSDRYQAERKRWVKETP